MTTLANLSGRLARLAALIALIVAIGSGPAYRAQILELGTALRAFAYSGPIALGAAALAILALIFGFVSKSEGGKLGLIVSLVIGLVIGGLVFKQVGSAGKLPMIHDITTDTENPPQFDAVVALRGEGTNPLNYIGKTAPAGRDDPTQVLVSELQATHYPNVQPLDVQQDAAAVFDAAETVAGNQGWEIVSVDPQSGRIEATATTFWFGFKDDVVIRVSSIEGGGSRVDVRSVSRVGMSDVGANAARIEKYLSDLAKALG